MHKREPNIKSSIKPASKSRFEPPMDAWTRRPRWQQWLLHKWWGLAEWLVDSIYYFVLALLTLVAVGAIQWFIESLG